MQKSIMPALVCVVTVVAADYPGRTWETGGRAGWNETLLKAIREYSAARKTSSMMIVESGKVVDQWGDVALKIPTRSVRKSFLSALYGIHVAEGEIDLGKTLAQLGIDDNAPSLSEIEKQATVLDLLRARSGVYHPVTRETAYMKSNRPQRGSQYPGAYHYYNNWDFNALGTIFEQVTRKNIFEDFKIRIAGPIGMEDFIVGDGFYERGAESTHRQYMVQVTARDMARFGYLYLRKGRWREQQVIPEQWVIRSTTPYSAVPASNEMPFTGYGLLWWTTDWGYSALGAGGHYIAVIPTKDLVIVHRVMYDPPREDVVPYREVDTMIRMAIAAAPAKTSGGR